jgi:hypothetical protein
VIGEDDLHGRVADAPAELLDRHARRDHRALAAEIRVKRRLVVEHADLDRPALRHRRPDRRRRHGTEAQRRARLE